MNTLISVPLILTNEKYDQLKNLQRVFNEACNDVFDVVQVSKSWGRVGLHHAVYADLRRKYVLLGSQMTCNVIYTVSRTCRLIFRDPKSPFFISKVDFKSGSFPKMRFSGDCPVFFDKHTVSLKNSHLSMYTLDGRIRFKVDLDKKQEMRFHRHTIKESALILKNNQYSLVFDFEGNGVDDNDLPDYLFVNDQEFFQIAA